MFYIIMLIVFAGISLSLYGLLSLFESFISGKVRKIISIILFVGLIIADAVTNTRDSSSNNLTGYDAVKSYIDNGIEEEKKCMDGANSNQNTDGRQSEYSRCLMLQVGIGDVRRECADEKVSDSQTEELIKYLDEKLKTLPNCKPRE